MCCNASYCTTKLLDAQLLKQNSQTQNYHNCLHSKQAAVRCLQTTQFESFLATQYTHLDVFCTTGSYRSKPFTGLLDQNIHWAGVRCTGHEGTSSYYLKKSWNLTAGTVNSEYLRCKMVRSGTQCQAILRHRSSLMKE